ncbi:hypothetical protein VPNG_06658 [Cytospora leucostoma]|uniref:Cytochrome P450 n=1 Tax=Cytospora leucostoma TaxID=1230097 RepID=A0A423WU37_9PEZI|nr:hypothetical protein VPNG_06658 [Cytospora leucostoma]
MILPLSLVISLAVYIASRKILQLYHSVTTRSHRAQDTPRLYPHLDPLLGLDLAAQTWRDFRGGELSEGLRRRHALLGRTFLANSLGGDSIYTVEPDNIRAVTTTHFSSFGKAGWVAEAAKHVGNGVLMNEGEAWRRSRAMLKPVFARSAVDEPGFMEPHVERLVAEMRRLSGEGGEVFDFHELACMFTLDIVTEFLFGRSTRCLEDPRGPEGREGMEFLALVKKFEGPSGEFIAVGLLAWLQLLPSYIYLIGLVRGMKTWFSRKLDGIMAEPNTTPAPNSPRSVFTAMKAAGIPVDKIQGELQNVFFASYDTTSAFLANFVYVLARYPDVQAKLRREIDSSLGGRHPTNHALAKMEYLQLVIMEGPDGRGPIVVRAGATVVWSTYTLHRDPQRYGSDWADFRPERWASLVRPRGTTPATDEGEGGSVGSTADASEIGGGRQGDDGGIWGEGCRWRSAFMPFGSGPRTCLGQQMVQVEVAYVVVRLLQELAHLDMECGGEMKPFREARAVSLYNADGVRISVGC